MLFLSLPLELLENHLKWVWGWSTMNEISICKSGMSEHWKYAHDSYVKAWLSHRTMVMSLEFWETLHAEIKDWEINRTINGNWL